MVDMTVRISESMKAFIDSKVGPGHMKDASAFMQFLITEAMHADEYDFTETERERIDQMLLEAEVSLERGDYAPLRPGEFEELAQRVIEEHRGRQA